MTPEDGFPRSKGVQYATGEEQKAIINSSRKNEETQSKQKQCPVVDVSDDVVKKHCIGIWNVRSMNQGKFGCKQDMARVNIDILVINQ